MEFFELLIGIFSFLSIIGGIILSNLIEKKHRK